MTAITQLEELTAARIITTMVLIQFGMIQAHSFGKFQAMELVVQSL